MNNLLSIIHSSLKNGIKHPDLLPSLCKNLAYDVNNEIQKNPEKSALLVGIKYLLEKISKKDGNLDEMTTKIIRMIEHELRKKDIKPVSTIGYNLKETNLTTIIENIVYPAEPMKLIKNVPVSEHLKYHLDRQLTLEECVFRHYSESYFNLINEIRKLYNEDAIELNGYDLDIIESNLGETAIYEGREVFLDAPIEEDIDEELINEVKHRGKKVKLNKPFRTPSGPKKFAVYVKTKKGTIKKVTFGDPKSKIRASNKARRKSFTARHKCSQKKDRTTAGYWSCRAHRIRSLGTKSKGKYW